MNVREPEVNGNTPLSSEINYTVVTVQPEVIVPDDSPELGLMTIIREDDIYGK